MESVLIFGGTGLIGRRLSHILIKKGYLVTVMTRKYIQSNKIQYVQWDPEKGKLDEKVLLKADYIINLTGENIGAKRWTRKQKRKIIDSRVNPILKIHDILSKQILKPKAYIGSSAIGYYGATNSDEIFTEEHDPGNDFLAHSCKLWENANRKITGLGLRTVIIRTGVVLSENAAAFQKIVQPMRFGVAAVLGNGKQYFPWIHIEDICNLYVKAIEDESMKGIYNGVAPAYDTNKEFTQKLRMIAFRKSVVMKAPSIALKIMMGEMSAMVLYGSRISAKKTLSAGFQYKYDNLEKALNNLLNK